MISQFLHEMCPEWILKVVILVIGYHGREKPDQTVMCKCGLNESYRSGQPKPKVLDWIGSGRQWLTIKTPLLNCCVSFTIQLGVI